MMISVVSWLVEGEDKGDACYLFTILIYKDDIGCFLICVLCRTFLSNCTAVYD